MTQAATQHLIGQLPRLANVETDISKRLPSSALSSLQGFAAFQRREQQHPKGHRFQMFCFILAPENFVCVGERGRLSVGCVHPPVCPQRPMLSCPVAETRWKPSSSPVGELEATKEG